MDPSIYKNWAGLFNNVSFLGVLYGIRLCKEMSLLEFFTSFIIGFLFLMVGIIAFFLPPKLPWSIRFIIIFSGIGFILYSILGLFGLVSS